VLDYPGSLNYPVGEKRRAVERLLRAGPVLLVLDNTETITDHALLEWLCQIPTPSKALATSRASLPAHMAHYVVELEPLDADQARELIADRLRQTGWHARLELLPQLLPLVEVAGGNPKGRATLVRHALN
jgi:hypothetical protein